MCGSITFRTAFTGLDHALVACGLTQILAEGSGCRWGGGAVGIPDHDSWQPPIRDQGP